MGIDVKSSPQGRFDGLLERTRLVWYSLGFAASIIVLVVNVISYTDIMTTVPALALPFLLLAVEMTTRRLGLRNPWRWLALACYAVCALVIVAIFAFVDLTGDDAGYQTVMIAMVPLFAVIGLCLLIVLAVRGTRAERIAAPIVVFLLPAALAFLVPANLGPVSLGRGLVEAVFVLAYVWASFRVIRPAGEGQVTPASGPGGRAVSRKT